MTKIQFELDGKQVEANAGETIWQVAKRQGREIPHLCYSPAPDYRPDGNCRVCMVEVEGARGCCAHGHVLLRMFRARHHLVPLSSSYLACHLRHNPLSGSRQTKRGALSARSLTAT